MILMDLDTTLFAQIVVFVFFIVPLLAVPWLLVIWLVRKLFGKRKDEING